MSFLNRFKNNQRGNGLSLPTSNNSSPSIFHVDPNNQNFDGSGKAIRMEAPIVREWKRSSGYTKGTYYCLIGFLFLLYMGYRYLRYEHSSIWLICHTTDCTLDITPRGFSKHVSIQFPRSQLMISEAIKTDKEGNFISSSPRLDDFRDAQRYNKHGKPYSSQKTSYKGPDLNGHYPSYRIGFRDPSPDARKNYQQPPQGSEEDDENNNAMMTEVDFEPIKHFLEVLPAEHANENSGQAVYSLILRKFNIVQSRRRVTTSSRKIDSYIKNRRHRLTVKETGAPCWQGIVCLVLGLIGFLLTLLLGQFWDPEPQTIGPGTRKTKLQQKQQPAQMRQPRPSSQHIHQQQRNHHRTTTTQNSVTSRSGATIRSRNSRPY